jgi:hypothetical protein
MSEGAAVVGRLFCRRRKSVSVTFRRLQDRRPTASLGWYALVRACVSCLPLFALVLVAPSARAEIQIERGFLPHDASPSSFAIGLPGGINFCFDPVRGAVSYVWTGGFLDLTTARPGAGKFISAAKLLGPIAYRETGYAPLRRGEPGRTPTVEFNGYTIRDDAIEFRTTVDGIPVRQEIRARPDGKALLCRFHLESGADAKWWHAVAGKPATELRREGGGTFLLELPIAAP